MERNQVLNEYWNLCKLLNQSNKLADEKTHVQFKIESDGRSEYRLLLVSASGKEKHKIEIARRTDQHIWERPGFTNFKNFEGTCSNFLNDLEKERIPLKVSQKTLSKSDLESILTELQKLFDSLLINYRP